MDPCNYVPLPRVLWNPEPDSCARAYLQLSGRLGYEYLARGVAGCGSKVVCSIEALVVRISPSRIELEGILCDNDKGL